MARTVAIVGAQDQRLEGLLREAGLRAVRAACGGLGGLMPAAEPLPDAVILDLRHGEPVPRELGSFRRTHPSIGVIVVAGDHDSGRMLEAMRAGVTEWFAGEFTAADLSAAVERLGQHDAGTPAAAGKVFAFLGAKGGVGTTTTAVNVAVALARTTGSPSLLIDLHLAYGDAALLLGVTPRFSIMDALENRHRLDAAFIRSLLTPTQAGPDLLASAVGRPHGVVDVRGVASVLEIAAGLYRWVVLDVPRSDSLMLDSLEGVTQFEIVANQELPTVGSAGRIAAALRQRYGPDRVEVIVSRHDRAAEIGSRDVARAVGVPVRHLIPSDYRAALEASNLGRPIVLDNHRDLAASYLKLARALAGLPSDVAVRSRQGGLLSLFGARQVQRQ